MAKIIENNIKKSITLNNIIKIDGVQVKGQSAVINSDKPEDINFSSWDIDKSLVKEHRIEVRTKMAEFEDLAYAEQDKLLKEGGNNS